MNDDDAEFHRYDERQFALILRRAAELQERDTTHPIGAGLTRREIEGIAAEAGIDAKYVAQAMLRVADGRAASWRHAVVPPSRLHVQRVLEGGIGPEALTRIIDEMQTVMGGPGSAREVMGGLEWSAKDNLGPLHLIVRPTGGKTRVQLATDRSGTAVVMGILIPAAAMFGAAVLASATPVPALAAIPISAGAGLLTARVLWGRVVRKWQTRMDQLLDRIGELSGQR